MGACSFDQPFEDVIYPKGDVDAVSISKRDVDLLLPDTFVNDTVIDFYIKYFCLHPLSWWFGSYVFNGKRPFFENLHNQYKHLFFSRYKSLDKILLFYLLSLVVIVSRGLFLAKTEPKPEISWFDFLKSTGFGSF